MADRYPEFVGRLQQAYETWWEYVSQKFDAYCETILGGEENPVHLTCHDWHKVEIAMKNQLQSSKTGVNSSWDQTNIRQGMLANCFWAIEVVRTGLYEFLLWRWPEKVDRLIYADLPKKPLVPSGESLPKGGSVKPVKVKLEVADVELFKAVEPADKEVPFRSKLKSGKTHLTTMFILPDGTTFSAYNVYAKRVEE